MVGRLANQSAQLRLEEEVEDELLKIISGRGETGRRRMGMKEMRLGVTRAPLSI